MSNEITTNMRAPRKAKAILDKMVANRTITEDGLRWLVEVTDPNHDTEITTVGYPDLTTVKTLTQCYTYTTNISAPGSVGTSTWDCHVLFAPVTPPNFGTSQTLTSGLMPCTINPQSGLVTTSGQGAYLGSGWTAVSGAAGLDISTTLTSSLTSNMTVCMPTKAAAGQYRLIASSVEVVNTTPELYRGGSVTCWRAPNIKLQNNFAYTSSATTTLPITVVCGNAPPTNQAQAQLYTSSRTWGADQGVYSICSMSDVENPLVLSGVQPPVLFYQAPSFNQVAGSTPIAGWTTGQWVASGVGYGSALLGYFTLQPIPWNWQGQIFAGLNSNSTLQVTARYIMERVPSVSEPDFLVLAKPPADYDPTALEIYTRVMTELPVAVPVGENPLGEWFNDVLEAVQEYAPKVGQLFGPAGTFIGNAVGKGAGMMLGERGKGNILQATAKGKPKAPKPLPKPPVSLPSPSKRAMRRRKKRRQKQT